MAAVKNDNLVKILLLFLILLSILNMPYWYYQVVRIFSMVGFLYLSYIDYKKEIYMNTIIFGILALLFNPIEKIHFPKGIWKIIDGVVGIILVINIFFIKHISVFSKKYLKK